MFYLHTSNRTEKLSNRLAGVITEGDPPSLFEEKLFLVQSRGMERMLSQYLADVFGVWCNASYLLPLQFINYLNESIGGEPVARSFDRDVLTWRLELLLRDISDPDLHQVAAYLTGEQETLKRFQLAQQLANLFDQYQIMRPDYLEAWQRDDLVSSEAGEVWQKVLWRKLRADSPGVLHRGETLLTLIATLENADGAGGLLPRRIFVFGLHTMPPLFLATLNALSLQTDVHLFLLSPCALYWGDIESRKIQAKRRLQQLDHGSADGLNGTMYHPLLSSLGRQGSDFQELLLKYVDYHDEGPGDFITASVDNQTSLLHRLQADILAGKEEPDKESATVPGGDDSIMIMSCHSRMREVMVLKDHILSWLYSDPSLELHDIIVMAPDIQEYSQLIPALFDDIQHSIADRYTRKKNPYFDTFLQFLALFDGRYGWSDLLSLLEKPEVFPRFSLSASDLEQIRHWVIASGIRWGLSSGQRLRDGLYEFDSGTWRAGLERMLMGHAIDSDQEVDSILPFTDIEGSQAEILGGLCQFVTFIEEMEADFRTERNFRQWSELFRYCCLFIFHESEKPELLMIYRVLSELDEKFSEFHDEPLSFEVLRSWLETAAEMRSSGGFLSGCLTFCSMLPMRSIPFRTICLLGLNDGAFPKNDTFATFDLMGKQYRHGDRSSRTDDRYQFLEAIMAARDRLYLSYIGQSIRTNRNIPPSVVIAELLEVLKHYYGMQDLTVQHPLQASNSDYFSRRTDMFSYDEYSCRVASTLREAKTGDGAAWFRGTAGNEDHPHIDLSELVSFLTHPQAYFVRTVMGISLQMSHELPDDHEPFALDSLARYSADQSTVEALLQGLDYQTIISRLQTELRWPLGTPGRLQFDRQVRELTIFTDRITAMNVGDKLPDTPVEVTLNDLRLGGLIENLHESGLFFYRYADLKGRDLLQAWIYHLVANCILAEPVATRIVARDQTITIDADRGGRNELSFLLALFMQGCRSPSCLYVEPAFVFAQQVISNQGRGRKPPIERARQAYDTTVERGFGQEWSLLYPEQSGENVLTNEFETLCNTFMVPLWEMVLSCSQEN